VGRLAELFPGSVYVFDTGLARHTSDEIIWEYAGANGFTIVTADSDFLDLAKARGAPPRTAGQFCAELERFVASDACHPKHDLNRSLAVAARCW
jgi:predicted nuclease of predicted toxin-antitoxin system